MKKIRAFFKDRDNRPANYYEMMSIAGVGTLNPALQAMIAMGELVEVICGHIVCLKWMK